MLGVAPSISAGNGNLVDAIAADFGSDKLAVTVNIEVDAGIAAPGAASENNSVVDSRSSPSVSGKAG